MAREPQTAFATVDKHLGHASHGTDIALPPKHPHDDGIGQVAAPTGAGAPRAGKPAVSREFVELLEGLNTTIEVANQVLSAATDALARQATDRQQAVLPPSQPTQSRRPRHRRWAVVSAASALALLGGLGWLLYKNVDLMPASPPPQTAIDTTGAPHAPAMAAVMPPMAAGEPTASVKPAEAETPAPLAEPLRGRPGEPIALGIGVPRLAGDGQVSLMVQAVPEGASLTAGQRMGGDTWILTAAQIPGAALLLPKDFAAGQVMLDLTFVASDGRIAEAHSIVALVERDPPRTSLAQQSPEADAAVAPAQAAPPRASLAQQSPEADAAAAPAPTAEDPAAPTQAAAEDPVAPANAVEPPTEPSEPTAAAPEAETPALSAATTEPATGPGPTQEPPPSGNAATIDATVAANSASEPAAPEAASPLTPPAKTPPAETPAAEKTGASPSEPVTDKAGDPPAPARTATVSTRVFMRAAPSNNGAVITVAPRGSSVEVIRCRAWCEVVFKGQRGFIHRSFISDGGSASSGGAAFAVRGQSGASEGWFGRIRSLFRPST